MTDLRMSEQCEFRVGPAITNLATDETLESQMVQVSQTTQDTTLNVGKATVTGDDVEDCAQSFTADCEFLTKISAWAGKGGTPTDKLECKLYDDNSNKPGTLMNTSTTQLGASDLSDTPALESWEFNPAEQTKRMNYGDKYWIVFRRTGSDNDSNYYKINYKDGTSTVANHALARSDGGVWTVDSNGYDLYHIIYVGNTGHRAKEVSFSGGERDLEAVKLLGYQEVRNLKRSTVVSCSCTRIFQDMEEFQWWGGTPVDVTGNYHRIISGEKASSDRLAKAVLFHWTDGTNHISILMNNAYMTTGEYSLSADGHVEVTTTIKCLASNFYYEDDF